MSVQELKTQLSKLQGRKELLQEQYETCSSSLTKLKADMLITEQAQVLITDTARKVQSRLSFHLQGIVQTAIDSIFPEEDYTFQIDFLTKANRTQVDMYLLQNGQRINPVYGNGGGLLDIITFALRLAVWSLGNTARVLILDEPFKYLSERGDLRKQGADMLKTLTNKLGLQVIMVTHMSEFEDIADRIFKVKKDGKYSTVEVVQ